MAFAGSSILNHNFQIHRPCLPIFKSTGPRRLNLGYHSCTITRLPFSCTRLRTGLLLLLLPQSHQTDTRDLDDLETDTGNITLGLTLTTETGEKDFVVLIDEVQATVVGD